MSMNARYVERIETAQRAVPVCQACGRPTRVVERDGAIYLLCVSRDPIPSGWRGWLESLAGHYEERLVEPEEQELLIRTRRARLRSV